jgi:two-component system cell cycle sensor histidine kinase/response regulator CckA
VAVALSFMALAWLNHTSFALLLDSQETGRVARESRTLAIDRETGIRGYLLSHQDISLAPELAARDALKAKLDSLVFLTRGDVAQEERAMAIRTAVQRWQRGWADPVMAAAQSGAVPNRNDELAGKELFDSIRSAFEVFLGGQQRIFAARVGIITALQRGTFGLIILELALLLASLIWFRKRTIRQAEVVFKQRTELEAQAVDLNNQAAELEEQAIGLEEQADEANRTSAQLTQTNQELEATIKRLQETETNLSATKSKEQEMQSLLDVVMSNAPVAVALYDSDRRIIRVNAAAEAITGVSAADHEGKRNDEVADGSISDALDAILEKVLSTGDSALNIPLTGLVHEGSARERNFLCSFFPVTLPGGNAGAGLVMVETTQYRQLEEQLLQSQKMEAVGRLAGGVAHDFNNMLTAIMSYSELILVELDAGSRLREDMLEIVKAATKAAALTRKLLAFSRQQVLRPSVVDLNTTIDALCKMMTRMLGDDIEISTRFAPALWNVTADQTEIERVMMNLVLNARDAMPDGGRLDIETSNVVVDEEYASTHADTKPGDYVMIAVTDSGEGMTREVREKVFDPFFTTKEKGKGTGLGLPSVYGIVKQSGGFLWVYSEVGHGTTFKVYLPKSDSAEPVTPRTPTNNRPVAPETILLVEDDDEVRQVAVRVLTQNGYRVLEAANGADALRICEKEGDSLDLIVTDIVMPEMGGSELANKVRAKQPAARILFTSGYTEDVIVRESFLAPGEEFIEKPFTPALLARKTRQMLDAAPVDK